MRACTVGGAGHATQAAQRVPTGRLVAPVPPQSLTCVVVVVGGRRYIEPGFLETRGTLLFGSNSGGAHHDRGSSGVRRGAPALGSVAEGAAATGGEGGGKAVAPTPPVVVLSTPPPRRITGFAAPSAAATC